jgi:FkbM family methyltransferase
MTNTSANFVRGIIQEYFPPGFKGTFLEVGAFHPTMISISYPLRSEGWNIISVEPNPEFIKAFAEMNLPLLPYAACAEDIGKTTFKVSPNSASCSALEIKENYQGFMGWTDKDYRVIDVEAYKLDTILAKHHPDLQSIDVLVIDVEGWELEVLAGFNLEKYNIKLVVLENFSTSPTYGEYMASKNYKMDRKADQDEFYIKM